ncbi:sugar ABC transporter ATP-binding protein [Mycetocola manganoxydans]|uniref:Sugar ABC transporter ATP-binding protein n=1 Tax=Mycetocola manganoxydans TaxID=699879 RepID=A0A3L7A2B1_9MICO|nr:sugar ABC transporter ATP-binding protein [Mycetocola manganoxydans]RLP73512.1 sugar ABC transporter ATP-binding protein [Mycetocola manganoxydans]GHD41351.1 xylose ABC transporter ATP-binding protein [Mycetocola manganoxydans]
MPLDGELPDRARLIAVVGGLPVADGASVIGAESQLIPFQSVADNVLLGAEGSRFFLRAAPRERRAMALLDAVGLSVHPATPVLELDAVDKRTVELARALAREPELLIVDERFDRFQDDESTRWFAALALAAERVRILVVVETLAQVRLSPRPVDLVVVVRNGAIVGTATPEDASRLTDLLGGTEAAATRPEKVLGPVVLELSGISVSHPVQRDRLVVEDASLSIRAGEIVGLGGAEDLVFGIFGASTGGRVTGTILLDGEPVDLSTVERAIAARVLFISEHPPTYDVGLIGGIPTSVSGESLARLAKMGLIDPRREYAPRAVPSLLDALPGARSRPSTEAMNEVLAGWVAAPPRVALITEPFSGLTAAETTVRRRLLVDIALSGATVILGARDPAQLVGTCDRIILQSGTRLTTELRGKDASLRGLATFRIHPDLQR